MVFLLKRTSGVVLQETRRCSICLCHCPMILTLLPSGLDQIFLEDMSSKKSWPGTTRIRVPKVCVVLCVV
jgi:hypothetical protein